jgi:hypothetical protein
MLDDQTVLQNENWLICSRKLSGRPVGGKYRQTRSSSVLDFLTRCRDRVANPNAHLPVDDGTAASSARCFSVTPDFRHYPMSSISTFPFDIH